MKKYNVSVVLEETIAPKKREESLYLINEVERSKVNVIITVGGDGTILWAHRYYKHGNIPPIISFFLVLLNITSIDTAIVYGTI